MEKKVSEKSKISTVLLAFFLGGFGAHRFYVGKTGTGIVMLLLSISIIGLIPVLIWSWIDIILTLCNDFTDSDGLKITK